MALGKEAQMAGALNSNNLLDSMYWTSYSLRVVTNNNMVSYFSHKEKPILFEDYSSLQNQWPVFIQQSSFAQNYIKLRFDQFSDYFFNIVNLEKQNTIGYITSMPTQIFPDYKMFPRTWDDALVACSETLSLQKQPNALVIFDIVIKYNWQNQSLATEAIKFLKIKAKHLGFKYILVYIRPILPLRIPIQEVEVQSDPWVKTHLDLGAKKLHLALDSMVIGGSLESWLKWTGCLFQESGSYEVPGGIVPVKYSHESKWGEYREPNYAVLYSIE